MSDDSNQTESQKLSDTIDWDELEDMLVEFDEETLRLEKEADDLEAILLRVCEMGPEYTRPLVKCLTRRLSKAGVLNPVPGGKHSKARILDALSDLKMILDEKADAWFDKECPF
jgi:hypothetical protein